MDVFRGGSGLEVMDLIMEYFTPINKDGKTLQVWCRQNNYAFKVGISYPDKHMALLHK